MVNMQPLWIIALLVASCGVYTKAQLDDSYDNYFNYDDLDDLEKPSAEEINESINKKTDIENDLKVEEEIQQFREADEDRQSVELDAVDDLKHDLENVDEYQFEDNRDKSKEEKNDESKDLSVESDGILSNLIDKAIADNLENRPEPDDPNAPSRNEDYALLWGDDSVAPLPVPKTAEEDENKDIIEETKQILEGDADNFEEEISKEIEKADEQPNLEEIVEETKQLLAESDDSFNDDEKNLDVDSVKTAYADENNNDENKVGQEEEDEDTVDKVYSDLNADLDKLFATLDKLKGDVSETNDDDKVMEKVLEDADNFFEEVDSNNLEGSDELTENKNYEDVDLDKLLEEILGEDDMKVKDSAAEVLESLENIEFNDELNEPNPDDANDTDVETLDKNMNPILYVNDSLIDEQKENAETLENSDENNEQEDAKDASIEKQKVRSTLVDELNSAELEDLVLQFSMLHSEDLDVNSDNFNKDVAPVHITLKLDEPTVITSPNYPSPYPTNNIVDWILEGPGEGIELNITNFAVNGALGDYLLIKPGGVEESGHEGLIFTYRLSSERRYRFTDVNRLFMRFESKIGVMSFSGFSLSAKMISPFSSKADPIPEPEAVVAPPHSLATVTLDLSPRDFAKVQNDFQQVLADMAEAYIIENDVDPGLNTTSDVTQITNLDVCPMTWPGYEGCTAVTFGVSLVYDAAGFDPRLDEDDLKTMWTTYVNRDPFALRLRAIGISEFYGPSSGLMTLWLVIAGGVVILMSVLALVLWRYSCFEGYTRMKTFSDTDSLHNEKRNMDLYPTPHQTLPPLYADTQAQEYKWPEDDTRVDMGGFANRSYAQENMYDFDSDEEVIPPRDRIREGNVEDYGSKV